MTKEMPKGYTCNNCMREHKYPGYVFAHWTDILTHQCECGVKYSIYEGKASPVMEKPKRKRA